MENKKTILGLDLGTNSIGWALIDKATKRILGMGSRIISMGTDKLDYEKGVGITKNADRRIARTIRKMNKRYKQRRNKLLFILHELGMLPNQFQFKNGIPEANKLQELELLPIKKGSLQLDSLQHYELRVNALHEQVELKDLGKILYRFNQLRGYAGGNNEDDIQKKKGNSEGEENEEKKKYEVITQMVSILSVTKSERKFKAKGGKNKGEELCYYDVTILLGEEEKEGTTMLQNLEAGKEEELEIRIKQTKKGETIVFGLPQKTNWRKQMEATEEIFKTEKLFISELLLKDLREHKWAKIRNRVILRNRYQQEFDAVWAQQAKHHSILNNCPKDKLEAIANYLYPGTRESQANLKKQAIEGGLKHILKEQVIYYQRPLKPQTELIGKCQFEKEERVVANSHPLFQEFRCRKQINQLYVTSKEAKLNERKKKIEYKYNDRYLTNEQKESIYTKLQNQKQVGFADIAKVIGLRNDKTEYLNGLNVKAKLKGCDTSITIKKIFKDIAGENSFTEAILKDNDLVTKIWEALYNNTGNEYDEKSAKVSAVINVLRSIVEENTAIALALKLAQNTNYPRKYGSLSIKAINKILPLMKCNPIDTSNFLKEKIEKIKHTIETGEIKEEDNIEPYMISYIYNNPNIMETGGMMDSFAASLIYGKHTISDVKPTITNYHDIQYTPNRNLRNPVVEQISNETMQVIKALWKQYKLDPKELEIRVELARDLKNSAVEREKIYKAQISSQKINESVKKRLIELKQEPTQSNIELYKLWSRQNEEEYPKQSKEPTQEEIQKLRIWEEQKCISPYTLKPIPLSKLFSPERLYDIDHIIPKSRLFDDSIANKVVCETYLNEEKSNRTAWEYITQQNSKYKEENGKLEICSIDDYINNINKMFFGRKKKYLLLEKIPSDFIERQKKDTQYISIAVKNELAKIVGSDNVKTSTGEVTSFLRSRWGLKKIFMKLTESRFKQMELWDLNKETGKPNSEWITNYYDKEKGKHIYQIKNWSKRYDHRHHAIDALVVALTEQSHIQRLNNLNKELQDELTKRKAEFNLEVKEDETVLEAFFNLEEKRREEIQKQIEGFRKFDSPFTDLIKQAKEHLETIVISHKPKDNLSIRINETTKKKELKIRGALHEATFYGKHNGQDTKTVSISNLTAKDISKITDPVLTKEIDAHRKKYESMKEAFSGEGLKAFNESRFQRKKPDSLKPPVYKLKIYYKTKEVKESSLQPLYENNDKLSVKTGGNYLFIVMQREGEKVKERVFDIVSLYDAAQLAKDVSEDFKQKIYSEYLKNNKADKVLFTLQQNELVYLPESFDDVVLNFTPSEFDVWINDTVKDKDGNNNKARFAKRIYRVVKFTGKDCFFIPHNYSNTISVPKELTLEQKAKLKEIYGDKKIPKQELNYEELGSFGISAKTEVNENFVRELVYKKGFKGISPLKIQDHCIKIKTDWLGNIKI